MAIDALLVYLPVKFGGGHNFGLPPMGVYYLASSLKQAGLNARVLDASIKGLTFEETIEAIVRYDPTVLGISAMTSHLKSLKLVVDHLNDHGYRGRICVGGPHFNATEAEAMEYLDVDYIFYSESEIPFRDFVKAFVTADSTDHIPGLVYRGNGKVVTNPTGGFVQDLDQLPFPDLRLGDPADYEFVAGRYDRITVLMASRGCPYRCKFCDVFAMWGRKLRLRTPKNICDEMEFNIRTLGIREFVFKDSTFTLNYKWLDRFLDELERRNLDVIWHCNTRTDRVNREMLKRMRKLGLRTVSYGVESGDQGIIEAIAKNIDLADVPKVFAMTEDLGLQAQAFFMFGHMGETPESAQRTLDLALKLRATFASFSPMVAYPGTPVYNDALKNGLLSDPLWYIRNMDQTEEQFLSVPAEVSPGQLLLPEFPPQEQIAFSKKAYRKFYLRPITIFRLFRRFFSFRFLLRSLKFLPTFLRYSLRRSHGANPFLGGYATRQSVMRTESGFGTPPPAPSGWPDDAR